MDCIRCGGEMDKRVERGVLIDHCRPCNAVWLDGGELESLELGLERTPEELEVQREAERVREASRPVSTVGLCPRCQRALATRSIQGREIDGCRNCGGIFFDHGELQAILTRSRAQISQLRRLWRRTKGA